MWPIYETIVQIWPLGSTPKLDCLVPGWASAEPGSVPVGPASNPSAHLVAKLLGVELDNVGADPFDAEHKDLRLSCHEKNTQICRNNISETT